MGGYILGHVPGIIIGLVLGWVFLPEPKFVRDFFVRIGWAKPVVVPVPTV